MTIRYSTKNDVIIRPFTQHDEIEVIGIWHRSGLAAYPYLPTWQSFTLEKAGEVFRAVIQPNCEIWVAEMDGRIAGFLAMKGSYIDRLYIDPPYWHKGLGKRFIEFAKQISPGGLELHTHQENLPARSFYEKEGFVAVKFGISPPPESAPDVEYHWRP